MTQDEEARRGEEAQRLLDHPLMVESFSKVREGITQAMHDSAFGDERTHHNLVIALQVLNRVEKSIQEVATTGKLAKLQLEQGIAGRIRAAVGF